jgi:glycosyltransferase involved in cell wall biosynthesis
MSINTKEISLIIPSKDSKENLLGLLRSIPSWEAIPNEIIIVDSSEKKLEVPEDIKLFAEKFNIRLLVKIEKNLFPGHARNIGINNSSNSLLAFLDTSTHPNKNWLSSALNILEIEKSNGVWGNTYYEADTYLAKIIRACTYGTKPIKTFPGSIIKKNTFKKCGLFIESSRAGEDGDWMTRSSMHRIKISNPKETLSYDEINDFTIKILLKKWFRNYSYSSRLPHRRLQKDIYFYFISFITIIVAYNWNRVVASYQPDSIFFIPYVTRISFFLLVVLYAFLRGILMPVKKGIDFNFIFPLNFIVISFVSGLIDVTKALAFGYSRFIKK